MEHQRPDHKQARNRTSKTRRARDKVNALPGSDTHADRKGARVAKVMARAGLCSRRDAEAWIAAGRVAVNGAVIASPAMNIEANDVVSVDGKPLLARERTRLFLFHKTRGLVTTNKDPEGRSTIFDYLHARHPKAPRLVSVGRLDINTEGLILLTNDGGLARVLELPSTGWLRRYRVRANGETDQARLDGLASGITLDGVHYAGIEAKLDRAQGANCWLTMSLREGKNREIKRVLEHVGLVVNRLIRISFGPFQLGDLAEGALEEVRTRVLRDQLGTSLLEQSGADLDAPVLAHAQASAAEPVADVAARHQHKTPRPRRADADPLSGKQKTWTAQGSRKQRDTTDRSGREAMGRQRQTRADEPPDKPKSRPSPGPRKHVSALRAKAEHDAQDLKRRHRLERDATADRKGRVVAVERRVPVNPPQKKRAGAKQKQSSADRKQRAGKAGGKRSPRKH